jgi:TRAP-type C4-dicarboxylate transport system substrate-binding protein
MFSEMGANPTPMSFSELYTALQQGTVDGQDNPYAIVATNKFDEVQKYMTDLSHTFDITCFSINDAFYQSLPEDLQAVVDEAAADAVKVNREQSQANEQTYIKDIQDSGCKITFLTDAQREAFKEATAGTYDFFREKYNPTVSLDTVLAKAQTVNEAN